MKPHEKIISQTAKDKLVPLGMFRKGTSRIWVEDNGWFFIVVEYRHHNYFQGAEVYVRMEALWDAPGVDFLSYISNCHRFDRVDYMGNDEVFAEKLSEVSDSAKEFVLEFRKYKDLDYAKMYLPEEMNNGSAKCWVNWNNAMFAYFRNDIENGDKYLNDVYQYFYDMGILCGKTEEQARLDCEEHPMVQAYHKWCQIPAGKKQAQVLEDIKITRQELRTHSAWKKLRDDVIYDV